MNISISVLFAVLCGSLALHAQTRKLSSVRFAGCYEVVFQKWHPMNEDDSPIPGRFQLLKEPVDERSNEILQMGSLAANHNMMERLWFWRPEHDHLFLSWGTGFGGFRGTMKQDRDGEFVGKVKEWCDSRCGWKIRRAEIRIRKTECTQ